MALKKPAQAQQNAAAAASAEAAAPAAAAASKASKFEAEDGGADTAATEAKPAAAAAADTVIDGKTGTVVETEEVKAELVPVDKSAVVTAAKPSAKALAVLSQIPKLEDVLGAVHDNVRVDWNSLPNIQATNGNFKLKEGNGTILGAEIHFQLVSSQDNYAVTPGVDDDEAGQYVRYSDDGKMLKDGVTTVAEHLKLLKELGYAKTAKCQQRIVLVGAMTKCDKKPDLVGELFQMDLAPTSLAKFKTFKIQAAWKLGKGKLEAENVLFVKASAEPTSAKGRDWTVVNFESSDVRPE